MPFDEDLAVRVRAALADTRGVTELQMFGGIAFMVNGHMACGVIKDKLVVRVGADAYDDALGKPHTEPMTFTGVALKGMVYVLPGGTRTSRGLGSWVRRAADLAGTLPSKKEITSTAKTRTRAKTRTTKTKTTRRSDT